MQNSMAIITNSEVGLCVKHLRILPVALLQIILSNSAKMNCFKSFGKV
jgi:hypothetical protein